jgi:uncharacterized protein (TIGR03083 family)
VHRDEIRRAIEAERLDLADLLDGLDPADWSVASLCPEWTVRDVVAHLALGTRLSRPAAIITMLRARGNIDRMIGDTARRWSARYTPAELVAQLRETAGSPRRPPGTTVDDPLVDVLVHGQDIARPLDRGRVILPARAEPALDRVWRSGFYGARKRFRGLRLVATDLAWAAGDGPEVRGPAGDLLLVATGRSAGLAALSGPGRAAAAARVT